MNLSIHNEQDRNAATIDAELSLRMVASLPAPVGIEDRLKAGLRVAPVQTGVIGWPLSSPNRAGWAQVSYMRAAAAAAIVFVVAGGSWGVYARFRPAPAPAAVVTPQRIDGGGGLSAAAARRTPKTVEGPTIAIPKTERRETGVSNAPARQHASRQGKKNRASIPAAPAVR